jgi:hypothetical protein
MAILSKTQIDKLGERLKSGSRDETDLRELDEYRRSFGDAYVHVVGLVRGRLRLEPTGRPAKSTSSIVDKLRRESIRLTQIQDIAGCRLVVGDLDDQDEAVQSLVGVFRDAIVVDRRQKPSHGYRAVHLIVSVHGKPVEIQVRTALQHLWAGVSEKFSDVVDPAIKYGGGEESLVRLLAEESRLISGLESDRIKIPLRAETVDATHALVMRLLRLVSSLDRQ